MSGKSKAPTKPTAILTGIRTDNSTKVEDSENCERYLTRKYFDDLNYAHDESIFGSDLTPLTTARTD